MKTYVDLWYPSWLVSVIETRCGLRKIKAEAEEKIDYVNIKIVQYRYLAVSQTSVLIVCNA